MNNTLNMKRLWLLIRRQAIENYKLYLLSIALMAGLLAVYYGITFTALRSGADYQELSFFFSLALSGSVFTHMLLTELHSTTTRIWHLMLPTSALEKLLVVVFYSIVVFVPVHMLVFYIIDTFFVSYYNFRHPEWTKAYVLDLLLENRAARFYYPFLIFQSLALIGAIYFQRYSYVKTIAALFAFFALIVFLDDLTADMLMGQNVHKVIPFIRLVIVSGQGPERQSVSVMLSDHLQDYLFFSIKYLLTPFLWIIAYFRLRETQVQ